MNTAVQENNSNTQKGGGRRGKEVAKGENEGRGREKTMRMERRVEEKGEEEQKKIKKRRGGGAREEEEKGQRSKRRGGGREGEKK